MPDIDRQARFERLAHEVASPLRRYVVRRSGTRHREEAAMNDDELRARLQAADPARRDAAADSWIDELVEATMTVDDRTRQDIKGERPPGRNRWLVAGAAAAVAVIAVGGYAFFAGDSGDDGDADMVELTGSSDAGVMLEGGIEFTEGERHLVTATDGNVNGCGFSGVYTDDMAAAFDEAFRG